MAASEAGMSHLEVLGFVNFGPCTAGGSGI